MRRTCTQKPFTDYSDDNTIVQLIKSYGNKKDVYSLRRICADKPWIANDIPIANTIIRSYGKCGAVKEAHEVFDELAYRDVVSWNSLLAGYAEQGFSEDAIMFFREMQSEAVAPDVLTFASCLKACAIVGALDIVKQIHACVRELLNTHIVLGTALVNGYAKCGAMKEAQEVFDQVKYRDVVSWNALISGYTEYGFGKEALTYFREMKNERVIPNSVTYACILKACALVGALETVEEIHDQIRVQKILNRHSIVGAALVNAYAKCGAVKEAREVFDQLTERNVVTWSMLIGGYSEHGFGEEAVKCFREMRSDGVRPDPVTYGCSLKACAVSGDLETVREIHSELREQRLLNKHTVLGTSLVNAYAKCGAVKEAQEVFEQLPQRDVVSWSALIAGYAEQGLGEQALRCFRDMESDNVTPDSVTYACILKACAVIGALDTIKEMHDLIKKQKLLNKQTVLGTALVNAYAKCGAVKTAQEVFDRLAVRDVVCWNALITGYAEQGFGEQALTCFREMESDGVTPDSVTYASTLKACAIIGDIDTVKDIHAQVRKVKLFNQEVAIGTALVNAYMNCGGLKEAQEVFDQRMEENVVTWNALIAGYVADGYNEEAIAQFRRMENNGVTPDAMTYTCTLKAFAIVGAYEVVKKLHVQVREQGLPSKHVVLGTILLNAYTKCGSMKEAREVFNEIDDQDIVLWNALIAGYAEQGFGEAALKCFREMEGDGVTPDSVSYGCILKTCASVGDLAVVKEIHDKIRKQAFLNEHVILGSALIDAYAKCGSTKEAQKVFDQLGEWYAVLPGTVITGNAKQGLVQQTYSCILKSSTIVGSLKTVKEIYAHLREQKLLNKEIVLGTTLVNAFAKCGALKEAQEVFDQLAERDVVSWNALIAGYSEHGFGEEALSCFREMENDSVNPNSITYACILTACATVGSLQTVEELHGRIRELGLLNQHPVVGNSLVNAYVKCGAVKEAQAVFDQLAERDDVCWNAVLADARFGQLNEILQMLNRMMSECVFPNLVTFLVLLNGCNHRALLEEGEILFYMIVTYGLSPTPEHFACMVDLFGRTGQFNKAKCFVLDHTATLLAFLGACAKWENVELGQWAFNRLLQLDPIYANASAYVCMANIHAAASAMNEADEVEFLCSS